MMKTPIHRLLPAALLMLAATACEDTLTAPDAPGANGDGPTLTLVLDNSEDNSNTRSTLENGAPVNHVQTVRILVFKGGTEDKNYTDATYVGEEIYTDNLGAIAWSDAVEGQEKPDKITYRMNYPFVEDETYTLLGVGQDDKFAETYDIELKEGSTTLANAYAKLKSGEGKGKGDIAQCDFYTGTTTFTHAGKNTHIDDLLMKRRVAGVMLYVTEIPQRLKEDKDYRITSIKVCLPDNTKQNSSVLLRRNFENWDEEPEGQTPLTGEDDNVVAEITGLDNPVENGGLPYTENNDFYMTDGKPATKRTGVYMLPLNATDGAATFTVKLYGKELDPAQTGGATVTGAEEILLKSLTVEQRNADGESVTDFPIRSNYLYSIGKFNPTEGVDEPISLSGSPIYLEVLPFTELEDNNPTFESARVQAVFDDTENPIYDCINRTFKVRILPPVTSIRGKVDKVTLTLNGPTYAKNEEGEFVNIEEDKFENEMDELNIDQKKELYGNWLYIKQEDDNTPDEEATYKKSWEISGMNEATEVTFFITDYARPRRNWGWKVKDLTDQEYSWQGGAEDIEKIDNDIRYMDVILTTYFTDGTNERFDTLRIRQYNTITVYYNPQNDKDNPTWTDCGFRREDIKDENGNRIKAAWKFQESGKANNDVYQGENNEFNGNINLSRIGRRYYGDDWSDEWNGSAMQQAQTLFRKISIPSSSNEGEMNTHINPGEDKGVKEQRNSGECWYLPARYELDGLMTMVTSNTNGQLENHETFAKCPDETNQVDYWYWTSTIYDNDVVINRNLTAWAYRYLKTDTSERADGTEEFARYQTGYIRQARRFPDFYKETKGGPW